MANSILTADEIKQLKELLPFGSIAKIAKEADVSRQAVKEVLRGQWINVKVLEVAYKYAEAERKRREAIANKIKAIIA